MALGCAAGLLLVAGSVSLWLSQQHAPSALDASGARVAGTITTVSTRVVAREHHVIGKVTVEYVLGDEPQVTEFNVGINVKNYHEGDVVPVAYDPTDPSSATLADESVRDAGQVPWQVPAMFGGLTLLIAGVVGAHVLATRRLLRAEPWLAVPATLSELPFGLHSMVIAELGDPEGSEHVIAAPTGLRPLPASLEPLAWVVGWGGRRFAIAPPGGRPVRAVRALKPRAVREARDEQPERPERPERTGRAGPERPADHVTGE